MREGPDILEKIDEKDSNERTGLLYACVSGNNNIIKMMYE